MSALETSVTLEDVFQVVQGRRVPLAAELAGYLALEIAESAAAAAAATGLGGDIDPRAVFIGEEGSVALVRPKRDASAAPPSGDTEASIRNILATLLDASGSKTPALGNVARAQAKSEGLRKLVEQLETALIPVNRAAGRRALARLAREVKRVTQGVGRNATRAGRDGDDAAPRSTRESGLAAAAHAIGESRRPGRDELADLLDNRPSELPQIPAPSQPITAAPSQSLAPLGTANTAPAPPMAANAPPTPPPPVVFEPRPEPRAGVNELVDAFGVSGGQGEAPEVSRELKAMAGLDPTPPPPAHANALAQSALRDADDAAPDAAEDAGVEALLADAALSDKPPASAPTAPAPAIALPTPAPAPVAAVAPPKPALQAVTGDAAVLANAPVHAQAVRAMDTMKINRPASPAKRGADRFLWPLVVVVVLAAGAGLFVMRPALFPGHRDGTDPSATGTNAATTTATAPAPNGSGVATPATSSSGGAQANAGHDATRCRAILLVNDAPAGSEILLREGTAPADVERMPVGARLEFVTTQDGFGPKRIVVPADATWDHGADGRPRYELAAQLDPSKAKPGAVDPWPPAEPGSEAGGNGPAGTVHIVSTPKGAEIWLLAGIGPQAKIDQQVRCDADLDVLIAGPTTFRKRLHKTAAELAQSPTETSANGTLERTVTLSAK